MDASQSENQPAGLLREIRHCVGHEWGHGANKRENSHRCIQLRRYRSFNWRRVKVQGHFYSCAVRNHVNYQYLLRDISPKIKSIIAKRTSTQLDYKKRSAAHELLQVLWSNESSRRLFANRSIGRCGIGRDFVMLCLERGFTPLLIFFRYHHRVSAIAPTFAR